MKLSKIIEILKGLKFERGYWDTEDHEGINLDQFLEYNDRDQDDWSLELGAQYDFAISFKDEEILIS